MTKLLHTILVLFLCVQVTCFFLYAGKFCTKNFLTRERNLVELYGHNTWVMVTGCGSGQGRRFVIEFAKRGFHVILAGRQSIEKVREHIVTKYPKVQVKCIQVDFCDAFKPDFFKPFEQCISELEAAGQSLSVLVNNIGHRVAWKPYHTMPPALIQNSIVCGTLVQSKLTQIALRHFIKRPSQHRSLLVNVTANCFFNNVWFGGENHISVPYLSVYEAANAFGFYHSNSIEKEYGDIVDVINLMPGAVVTENTQCLQATPFNIDAKAYVKNVFKLFGNYSGPQFGHWGHELSAVLCNLIPPSIRDAILLDTGMKITSAFMSTPYAKALSEQ